MKRLAVFLVLMAGWSGANAVCAGAISVCSAYSGAAAVFRGRVLEVSRPDSLPGVLHTYPDGSTQMSYIMNMKGPLVRFAVLETFRGELGSEISVSADGGVEGINLQQGEEYLVFAYASPNGLVVNGCTRTARMSSPQSQYDLQWLRSFPTAPPVARIFGNLFGRDLPWDDIQASMRLAETSTQAEKTVPVLNRQYEFKDLPPGTYVISAVLPAGLIGDAPRTVKVEAKGCAEVDWNLQNDSHVRGLVKDHAGQAVGNVSVALLKPSSSRNGWDLIERGSTHADGSFDIAKAPPGDYWVALNIYGANNNSPYPTTYAPGDSDRAGAKLIHLAAGGTIEGVTVTQADPLEPATVTVRVMRSDGTPVNDANLIARVSLHPTQAISGKADADGHGVLHLYAGEQYSVVANTPGYREPACAGPIRFVAKEGLDLGTMTLDKSFAECRKAQ